MAQSCHTHDIGQVLEELKLNPYTLPPMEIFTLPPM